MGYKNTQLLRNADGIYGLDVYNNILRGFTFNFKTSKFEENSSISPLESSYIAFF
jgi:hypothetical protein